MAGEVREQVTEWMSSYKTPLAERRWEPHLENLQTLITPEAIQGFDTSIHKWLMVFVSRMRRRLGGVGDDDGSSTVFLTWTAKPMSSSMISAQINSCWQKAGKQGDRASASAFRKAAVSAVHGHHGHLKTSLAASMDHNPRTSEKYYSIRQKGKNAAKTAQALSSILRAPVTSETADSGNSKEDEHWEDGTSERPSCTKRHAWTREEESALSSLFQNEIKAGCIDIDTVKEKIQDDVVLQEIPAVKIYDKVRYVIRTSKRKARQASDLVELPQEAETADERVERLF